MVRRTEQNVKRTGRVRLFTGSRPTPRAEQTPRRVAKPQAPNGKAPGSTHGMKTDKLPRRTRRQRHLLTTASISSARASMSRTIANWVRQRSRFCPSFILSRRNARLNSNVALVAAPGGWLDAAQTAASVRAGTGLGRSPHFLNIMLFPQRGCVSPIADRPGEGKVACGRP